MIPQIAKDWFKKNNIDLDALVKAYAEEKEVDFSVPTGNIYTDAQLQERDGNSKTEGVKEGEGRAMELAKTEFKKRGIELKGSRWGDLVNEVNALTNTDKDTKITGLQEQNIALLADIDRYKTEAQQAGEKAENVIFEHGIYASLPSNSMGLSASESYALMKMRGYSAKKGDNGEVVWEKNGQIMKDGATHGPLSADKAISTIWSELKWDAAPQTQGRNITSSGASSSGSISTFSAAKTKWLADNPGKGLLSPEFSDYVNSVAKDNPSFTYEQ